MTTTRVLVTGATGKIGGAVAAQLLEKGVHDQGHWCTVTMRAARGVRALGAEVVVADMFDIQQVHGRDRPGSTGSFFNPPYHPSCARQRGCLRRGRAARGVEAVVALGQWLASPEHPSLMTRQALADRQVV